MGFLLWLLLTRFRFEIFTLDGSVVFRLLLAELLALGFFSLLRLVWLLTFIWLLLSIWDSSIRNYWTRLSRIWRILQVEEGVIHWGRRPRWITFFEICRILHILRKPNSIIALLLIQNIFKKIWCNKGSFFSTSVHPFFSPRRKTFVKLPLTPLQL